MFVGAGLDASLAGARGQRMAAEHSGQCRDHYVQTTVDDKNAYEARHRKAGCDRPEITGNRSRENQAK